MLKFSHNADFTQGGGAKLFSPCAIEVEIPRVGSSEGKKLGCLQEQAACNFDYLCESEETPSTYGRGKEFQYVEIQGEGCHSEALAEESLYISQIQTRGCAKKHLGNKFCKYFSSLRANVVSVAIQPLNDTHNNCPLTPSPSPAGRGENKKSSLFKGGVTSVTEGLKQCHVEKDKKSIEQSEIRFIPSSVSQNQTPTPSLPLGEEEFKNASLIKGGGPLAVVGFKLLKSSHLKPLLTYLPTYLLTPVKNLVPSKEILPTPLSWIIRGVEKLNVYRHLTGYRPTENPLYKGGKKAAFTLAEVFTPHFIGYRKAAFTLAEVLITLGIIGVVAALTIPQLIKNYQYAVLQTQFKKAYADLNMASKNFQVHNGLSVSEYSSLYDPGSSYDSNISSFKLFQKEFNAVIKTNNSKAGSTDADDNPINARPYKNNKGWVTIKNKNKDYTSVCDISGFFFDAVGRAISFDDRPTSGKNGPKICIDINGEAKPNMYGADFFVFMFTTDGYVIPYMQKHKNNPPDGNILNNAVPDGDIADYCDNTSSDYLNSTSCANFALINQHPKSQNKDYWHDFVRGN